MIELQQRKFLNQLIDFLKTEEEKQQLFPRVFSCDVKCKQSETNNVNLKTEEGNEKPEFAFDDYDVSIRIFCECERGWHSMERNLKFLQDEIDYGFFKSIAPYSLVILKLLEKMAISMNILENKDFFTHLEKSVTEKDLELHLKTAYLLMRQAVIRADVEKSFGDLRRCQMSSGRIIWLCEKHLSEIPGLAILPNETSKSKENAKVDEETILLTEELAKLNGQKKSNLKKQFRKVGFMVGGAQVGYKKIMKRNSNKDLKNGQESHIPNENEDVTQKELRDDKSQEKRKSKVCSLM